MSSFKEEINKSIPTKRNTDEAKMKQIQNDILQVSDAIKKDILHMAKYRTASGNKLQYKSILLYEGFLQKKSVCSEVGFFNKRTRFENTLELNADAIVFYNGLKEVLLKDDILISNWELAWSSFDIESNPHCHFGSYYSYDEFKLVGVEPAEDPNYFGFRCFASYPFNDTFKEIYENGGYFDSALYYKGKKVETGHSQIIPMITISFSS